MLIVEAYDARVLDGLAADEFSAAALTAAGASPAPRSDRYRLAHLLEDSAMKWSAS